MATFNAKTFRAILADMQSWIIANQDKITDFNEGSGIAAFCEAVAQQIEQVYLRGKIGFIRYLPNLPFYAFGFSKHAGTEASGIVRFSRNVATVDAITIPVGVIVSTPSGLLYTTTSEGTIAGGATESGDVSVEANEIGASYNVPATSISIITTSVIGVDTVNNAAAMSGGSDQESDNAFQQRFREYILGLARGSNYGLITVAKSVTGVRSASVIEHFPPLSGIYNVSLYIDDGAGNAPAEMIAAVENVIEGDGTVTYPGYKPAGINLRVLAPTKVTVDVTVEIDDTGDILRDIVSQNVQDTIEDYINNLQIGESVVYNELVQRVMAVIGVYDLTLSAPAANVSIGTTQVARTGTITITFA
jgi:uncharacterized phage protein gp47/JayE